MTGARRGPPAYTDSTAGFIRQKKGRDDSYGSKSRAGADHRPGRQSERWKVTVFTLWTHLHQHTGTGRARTVSTATGVYTYHNKPTPWSICPGPTPSTPQRRGGGHSDYLLFRTADVRWCSGRHLSGAESGSELQILEIAWRCSLRDLLTRRQKRALRLTSMLSGGTGLSGSGRGGACGRGLDTLRQLLEDTASNTPPRPESTACRVSRTVSEMPVAANMARAASIAAPCDHQGQRRGSTAGRKLDRLLTSKPLNPGDAPAAGRYAVLTMVRRQHPQRAASRLLLGQQEPLRQVLQALQAPGVLRARW